MHLDLVEARRRRRKAHEPVDANNASPPRRQRERVEQAARTHVLCLYALAGVASPDVLRDVAGLPRPEGEPAYQGRRLVPAEVASERRVLVVRHFLFFVFHFRRLEQQHSRWRKNEIQYN